METFVQHLRAGARSLRHAPGFAATAIGVLALGIGLSTAVFTVADALLLRRLPVRDQERVVVLSGEAPSQHMDDVPLDLAGARDFARRSRALRGAAFFMYQGALPVTARDGDRASRLHLALVSGDWFDVLGTRATLGRALRPSDDAAGAAPVLVLSHRAWRERFGGARDVVGRRVTIHEYDAAYTVVGVMPPGLDFPRGADAWVAVTPRIPAQYMSLDVVGRLAPDATAADARAELTAWFRRDGATAFERGVRGVARRLPDLVLGDTRAAVVAFAAAAGLLLVITCIDVANLLLVRGLARAHEVAVRAALGASRARIAAQLLTEHALLAVCGGALGIVVAAVAVRAFVALAPAALPRLDEVALNGAALAGALGITAAATLLFAVAPALVGARGDGQRTLRSGARQSATRGARLAREALVAGQIALALVVLSAAALLARSLAKLSHADLAFDPSRLTVAELALPPGRYDAAAQQLALFDRLLPAVEAVPGVRAASPVVSVPYAGMRSWVGRPRVEGQSEAEAARNPMLDIEVVGPHFFSALGMPVLRGRAFSDADRDGAPPVVVLSASAARAYWPNESAVGKRLFVAEPSDRRGAAVVGVVPDTRYRDLREPHATIYFPLRQSPFPFAPTTLVVRADRASADVASALRRALAESSPDVALANVAPFDALLAGPLAQPRMNVVLLAVFAAAAVVLAAVGLFGVLAATVRQRSREIGVRMALGASSAEVGRLVLRRGIALAAAGTAVGLLGALATNRVLAALLFGVSPTDAVTLAGAAVGLLLVAALASFIPARAGARVDPIVVLRTE